MGVPAFFRWLSKKYPSIIVHCVEEKRKDLDGTRIPVDTSKPNPNDIEFDNLYLDMNGIIHPCCHPEDKPAPANEDEMMVDIFDYIDRIFAIVRPRKLLYMAIDGVAPRAKMNQQRSRRFRAAKESTDKRDEMARIKQQIRENGGYLPPEEGPKEHFDSNCITPGTPFMWKLAECLRYYIHDRLNNDPGWRNIKVILSDANVPGEGEHKIMDYIRRQRAQPDHDPNTHHCLCGADADLIMLGLATHEPHFTIIREEFKPNKVRPCDICGQTGHEMKDCVGAPRQKQGEHDEISVMPGAEQEFIFLRLTVLREYLTKELTMTNLPFKQDIERAIDDWVFMCFFVGNDFLPHLPSLEIREGAIDRLVKLYKSAVYKTGGYITDSGFVFLERVQLVLQELGKAEDEIFKRRRDNELNFRARNKAKRRRERQWKEARAPSFVPGGQFAPQRIGSTPSPVSNPRQAAYQGRREAMSVNEEAAKKLKAMLNGGATPSNSSGPTTPDSGGRKRKAAEAVDSDSEPEPEDEVKLWEDGWRERYYQSKFGVDEDDITFRHTVGHAYVLGLCWVLQYYYQGCPSWEWYFPYHYSPFASDFVNITEININFPKTTKPFQPLEQLMGVFPAASKQHLPITWQRLMCDPESEIIDFYPVNFKIDLNGKKYAWQGVALLPFVDEIRLKEALKSVYPDLTSAEKARNVRGNDRLFVRSSHPAFNLFDGLYENDMGEEKSPMNTKLTHGMQGSIWCDKLVTLPGVIVKSPLPNCPDLKDNQALSVMFQDPQFDLEHVFKARVLPGAKAPPKTLKPEDFDQRNQGQSYRPQLGFTRDSGYRGRGSYDPSVGIRHLRGAMGSQGMMSSQGGRSYSDRDRSSNNRGGYGRDNYNNRGGGGGGRGGGRGGGGGYGNRGGGGSGSWQRNLQNQQSAYQGNYSRGNQQGYGGGYNQGGYGGGQQQYGGYGGGGYASQIESYSTNSSGGGGYGGRNQGYGGNQRSQGYGGNQGYQGGGSRRGGSGYPNPPSYGRRY